MSDQSDIQDYQALAQKLEAIDRSNLPSPTSPRALKQRIDTIEAQNHDIMEILHNIQQQLDTLRKTHSDKEDLLALRKRISALKANIDEKAPKQNFGELQNYVKSLPTTDKMIAMGAGVVVVMLAMLSILSHYHLLG